MGFTIKGITCEWCAIKKKKSTIVIAPCVATDHYSSHAGNMQPVKVE